MAGEFIAGLGIFKTLLDSTKGLKDINDTAVRNAAVVELQEKILTAQAQQTALVERIRELEVELTRFETWDREKQRYQLTDHGGGTFTFALKQGMEEGEPFHRICAHCYQQRRKSILQSDGRTGTGREKVLCPDPACRHELYLGVANRSVTFARGSGWTG